MIVVDTNVVVYLSLDTPQTQLAQQIRDADPDWRVPPLWRYEFRNAAAQHMRSGGLTLRDAIEAVRSAERLLSGKERSVDPALVMRLVADSNLSAYDCEFVALAQTLGVVLVTWDRRIRREFPEIAVSPDAFTQSAG